MKAQALEAYTVRDVLKSRGTPTLHYTVSEGNTVQDALSLMYAHDIVSLPVFERSKGADGRYAFIDIVSLYDLRDYITLAPGLEDEVQFQLLSGRASGKPTVLQDSIEQVLRSRKHAAKVISADAPLEDLLTLFTNHGQHRVLVSNVFAEQQQSVPDTAHEPEETGYLGSRRSSFDEGECESGVCGLTQYDVVMFIQAHNHLVGAQLDMSAAAVASPLARLGGSVSSGELLEPFLTIRDSALTGLKRLRDIHTSALPVVDYEGRLVTEAAGTAMRALAEDKIGLLGKPILAFMFGMHLPMASLYIVSERFTLGQVMAGLLWMNSRRAWLVDEDERPVAVITLTDVLRQFL